MRLNTILKIVLVGLIYCSPLSNVMAQEEVTGEGGKVAPDSISSGILVNDLDPPNQLEYIKERRTQKASLFRASPLEKSRDRNSRWKDSLHSKTGIQLGISFSTMFQGLSKALPGEDNGGVASTFDFIVGWDLINRGKPNQGKVFFQIEGRWDYGTTGPMDLGPSSIGSLGFTANTYAGYEPTFLPFRNFYWQQGSKEAGWVYRAGRISVDQTFSTSRHISPKTTFAPISGTGPFAIGLSDTGWGISGAWYFSDRVSLIGAVADANGNRQDLGDIAAGDFFSAIELAVKIAPQTSKAGYSRLTLWHTDGTKDGQAINGQTGPEGWGFFLKHEQELSADGRMVGLLRYGQSFKGSAMFEKLAAAHWLLYDPHLIGRVENDLVGVAVNWVNPTNGARGETNVEAFYRFPFFNMVDTTLSYQAIFNPALDLGIDFVSVYSFRITTSF